MAATYSISNFLGTYAPTDVVLKVFNISGVRTFGVNVCQYDKATTEDAFLWIAQVDQAPIILEFGSTSEAQTALQIFQNAIDALTPNCPFVSATPAAPPQTIISITLIAYQAAQSSNSLIPLQWYDINDTLNVFGLGATIRAQARTINDFEPSGIALTSGDLVTINVVDGTVQRRENVTSKTVAENRSYITNTSSMFMKATNFSTIVAVSSLYIEANTGSTLNVTNCTYITAINGSSVTLTNCEYVSFNNITANLNTYSGLINNVQVDQSNTIGKLGRQTMDLTNSETLYSYIALVEQVTPTLTGNLIKTLANPISTANGEFRILVGSGLGSYTLTIQDTASNILATITAALANTVLTFRWNKNTNLFVLVPNTQTKNVTTLVVASNGQTSITGISPVPTSPATSELIINGDVQVYGNSADYYIVGNTLFWVSPDFILETTDKVILKYT